MTKIKMTDEQRRIRDQKILEMYRAGAPYKKIRAEFRVCDKTIRTLAKKDGCWIRGRQGLTNQKTPIGHKPAARVEDYSELSATEQKTGKRCRKL